MSIQDIVVIGAGAAGCFSAAVASEINPSLKIRILEKTRQPLAKVKISGGGRCNVTHSCFDPSLLIESYPRGRDFLRNAFSRFQPRDMIDWLSRHGVAVKTEKDGRMFPITDRSQTVIECLLGVLEAQGVVLSLETEVTSISLVDELFYIETRNKELITSRQVLVATGGLQKSYFLAQKLDHSIDPGIPSLFTFELEEEWIKALSGSVAKTASVYLEGFKKQTQGPVLVTHWGLSGPAVLKLSAFAARWLYDRKYQAKVILNWVGISEKEAQETLFLERKRSASKKVFLTPLFELSKNLWKSLLTQYSPHLIETVWSKVSKQDIQRIAQFLTLTEFTLVGKSINKEEFVTCGGVDLKDVDPKTFQSKKVPGLYFAGEVLDIDGITGGFNFQNAWTSGYLAAHAMSKSEN
jgi:predicted Rossmann fold flavoprotein